MLESIFRKVLRDVFGGGANISAANPLEVHDPKVGSLISYEGTTTANGAPLGASLVCSDLTTKPDFDGNLVIITSGAYEGQARDINGVTTGGTVTPSRPFGGLIVSGTKFVIVGITTTPAEVAAIEAKLDHASHGLAALKLLIDLVEGKLDVLDPLIDSILEDTGTTLPATLAIIAGYLDTEVAAIEAKLDLPAVDEPLNTKIAEVLGNKADTPSDDPDVNTLSLMRLLKSLMRAWKCVIPNIDVSLVAIDSVLTTSPSAGAPDVENTIMDLPIAAGTMYKLEDIIIKVSGYGTGTQITIQVWELLNGNLRANYVTTHSIIVPTSYPITTYLTLVDITGKPALVGDGIAITVITDMGVTGALQCTYTYSTARVS